MDVCSYCRKYHNPHEVCDAYIEAIEKGAIMTSPEEKLNKLRDDWARRDHDDIYASVGPMFTAEHFESAHERGSGTLAPTWLKAQATLELISEMSKDEAEGAASYEASKTLAEMDKLLEEK